MSGRRRRSDLLLAAAGLAGLAAFSLLYRVAFPQAAVRLQVTRSQARRIAEAFLEERGADLAGFRRASTFSGRSLPLVFLQRTLGLEEASRWAREEVPVWSWEFRWFRPLEKEEWRVGVGVDGAVVRFRHLLEEAAEGAELDQGEALAIAEAFLRTRGWRLADWERVEAATERRERRADHRFTWERRGSAIPWREGDPEAGSGAVRLSVTVVGDRVGGYSHFLKVPEEFRREFERTAGVGAALTVGSLALIAVLALLALALSILRTRRGEVAWRTAFVLALAVSGLFLLQQLTSWRLLEFAYPTAYHWSAYLGMAVVGLLLLSVVYGVFVLFAAAAGESVGRETYPGSLRGMDALLGGRLGDPAVVGASLRGYALGFLFLGYLAVFYVGAERLLGAWLPAEGPYSRIFDLYLPFLTPLTVGLVAAISEEVTFRLFGISLVRRYLRSTALALLLPAAVWAFAHSAYPVFPVYVRGIELTLGGLLFGVAFLRLGLLTCIVAHYVVDAVLLGLPLLTSGSPAYLASGFAVMGLALLPAVLGLGLRLRRGPGRPGGPRTSPRPTPG